MPHVLTMQTLYNCTNGGVIARMPRTEDREALRSMITIFVVDDQDSTRTGLRLRIGLEDDLAIVGEAGDADSAFVQIAQLRPDVVVMDVAMPGVDGISATTELRARMPELAVVMLSLHDDQTTREAAADAGAVAFIGKQEPDEALLTAIRSAHGNQTGSCGAS
jgi:two-component system response regulator NreC